MCSSPHSPDSRAPVVSSSEDEYQPTSAPVLEFSDSEETWLRSPTKSFKRRFQGRRNKHHKKVKVAATPEIAFQTEANVNLPNDAPFVEENNTGNSTLEDHSDLAGEDDNFERYVRMVDAGCLGYDRIGRHLYVVQGWDSAKQEGQMAL
ncbi:hypothetical protein VNI00_015580 [Paramarasmius palmivorus]|uniref:Uncharacterized protein n=1 Tax=Paramarasmius palmivorus TaxID=297713 RepID=A0AAW0BK59_9AGAR